MSVLVGIFVVTLIVLISLVAWVVWLNWSDNRNENTIGRQFDHYSGKEHHRFRDEEEDDRDA